MRSGPASSQRRVSGPWGWCWPLSSTLLSAALADAANRSGLIIPQPTARAQGVVLIDPARDDDADLEQGVQLLTVEQLVAHRSVEPFLLRDGSGDEAGDVRRPGVAVLERNDVLCLWRCCAGRGPRWIG